MIVFGVLREFIVWVNGWPNYKMASPSDLWPAFWKFRWLFVEYGWDTLWRTVAGLIIAVIFGIFLGMIMGLSRTMRDALYPLLVGFNAIPKATVVPIIALFVGQHDMNTILIAFLISFSPIAVTVSIGLRPWSLNTATSSHRLARHHLLEDRPTKDIARVFGAPKVAVTLAFIGTNLGDCRATRKGTWSPVRQWQKQRRLPSHVCRTHRARAQGHIHVLYCSCTGEGLCRVGRTFAHVTNLP